jgi:hypothetical protein
MLWLAVRNLRGVIMTSTRQLPTLLRTRPHLTSSSGILGSTLHVPWLLASTLVVGDDGDDDNGDNYDVL